MSASNAFETGFLQLVLQNIAFPNIGDASGLQPSSAAGSLYIALHTADPGEAGSQTTSECAYTSYSRIAVVRSVGGFAVSGSVGSNAAEVQFPQATGGSESATHFSIGTSNSGAGNLLFSGALNSTLAITTGVQPTFAIGQLTVTAD